jgi:hypothetical protein
VLGRDLDRPLNRAARSLCLAKAPRRRNTLHTQMPIAGAIGPGPASGDTRASMGTGVSGFSARLEAQSPHYGGCNPEEGLALR